MFSSLSRFSYKYLVFFSRIEFFQMFCKCLKFLVRKFHNERTVKKFHDCGKSFYAQYAINEDFFDLLWVRSVYLNIIYELQKITKFLQHPSWLISPHISLIYLLAISVFHQSTFCTKSIKVVDGLYIQNITQDIY